MSSKFENETVSVEQVDSTNVLDMRDRFKKTVSAPVSPISAKKAAKDQQDDEDESGDSGESGVGRLILDEQSEYEQRIIRRAGEAQYGEHVKDARHPDDLNVDDEMGMGMTSGVMAHPLLADMPEGADSLSPLERMMAADSDAAKIELKRQLENKKAAAASSSPTFTR